jgi:hypothetical protein
MMGISAVLAQVPDNTTFNLDTVVKVVNPTTDDLQDCFNDANASLFDPTYSGSKNSLLNFRNYGAASVFPEYVSNGGIASSNTTSISVSYPSSIVATDYLVMVIAADTLNSYPTISGWSQVKVSNSANGGYSLYFRAGSAGLSGSVSASKTSYSDAFGIIMRFSNGSGHSDVNGNGVGEYAGFTTASITPDDTQLGALFLILFDSQSISITPYSMDIDMNVSSSSLSGIRFVLATATDGTYNFYWQATSGNIYAADTWFSIDE